MDIKKTATGTEPLTATEVKNYLKIDFTEDDTMIGKLITGCREMAEQFTGRSFIESEIEYFDSDNYEKEIRLPYPDHNTITAVTINGSDVLSGCQITGNTEKIVVLPFSYQNIIEDEAGVKITYTTTGNCPDGVKLAILKAIGDIYEQRGNTFEGSVSRLSENSIAMLTRFAKL